MKQLSIKMSKIYLKLTNEPQRRQQPAEIMSFPLDFNFYFHFSKKKKKVSPDNKHEQN